MRIPLTLLAIFAVILVFPACKDTNVSPLKHVRFDPELLNRIEIADSSLLVIATPTGMVINPREVQVTFRDNLSYREQQELLTKYGFVQNLGMATPANSTIAHKLELVDGLDQQQIGKALYLLSSEPGIVAANPTFVAVR